MADTDADVTLRDAANDTFVAATNFIGGKHYQIAQLAYGGPASATQVSASNPLPVYNTDANANGQAPSANSAPVVVASDQSPIAVKNGQGKGKLVAASQTDTVLGTTGNLGDHLSHVTIIPESTTPGAVSIKDGSGSSITIFAGGTLPSVIPFTVVLGWDSTSGPWKATTGSAVHILGFGRLT